MRRARIAIVAATALLLTGNAGAQLGGILNRAKKAADKATDKVDSTKEKAKPATDRAEKAADTFQPWSAA